MPQRRVPLVVDEVYHVFSRSIAKYTIFSRKENYLRFKQILEYYKVARKVSFSHYLRKEKSNKHNQPMSETDGQKLVDLLGYCIMPTHIHLILMQYGEQGISIFMKNVLNSYTHYFNNITQRMGPLWESRFKYVRVKKDEQLLHLTRYIHLNPVTAYLVEKPELWEFSSYNEYCGRIPVSDRICKWDEIVEIKEDSYKDFVENDIDFQRELARIKNLLIE
ncbi:MAG TPA: transposase [bacterium]|nr:transposase [bacterium]